MTAVPSSRAAPANTSLTPGTSCSSGVSSRFSAVTSALAVRLDLVENAVLVRCSVVVPRPVQPRVAAAQPDQFLVQPVGGPPSGGGRPGRRGELRADGVVAARAFLLDAAERLLVAVVDRRGAADGEQHDQRVRQVALVVEALAMRVTSWLPTNVCGTNVEEVVVRGRGPWRARTGCASLIALQIAFHSSYWVTASMPAPATIAA